MKKALPQPTLRQIRGFLAVADQGTFTKAAVRLHIAQPALSQLVRELERELGIRLFNRTTRRVELTQGGREFQRAAVRITQDLDLAVADAKSLAERRRGRVVIAAPPFLAATILPSAIVKLRTEYPGLHVDIIDAGTGAILEAVRTGSADLGFGTFPATENDLVRSKLVRDRLMLFCSATHRFANRRNMRWRDLIDEPLVTLTRDSGIRLLVELGYEAANIPLRADYQVTQISTALALAGAGLGIAVLPAYVLAAASLHRLSAVQLSDPVISRDVELIQVGGRSVSPAAAAFARCLRSLLRP